MDKELIFAATGLVRDMAQQKPMTADEIVAAVSTIAHGLKSIQQGPPALAAGDANPCPIKGMDPKKAIKESSITCCECGKPFKVITKKHLATHGITPDEYRAKYGYKKGVALCAKSLQRERRKKMTEMKLWERKGAAKAEAEAVQ